MIAIKNARLFNEVQVSAAAEIALAPTQPRRARPEGREMERDRILGAAGFRQHVVQQVPHLALLPRDR